MADHEELERLMGVVRTELPASALANLDQLVRQGRAELDEFVALSRQMYEVHPDWTVVASLTLFGMTQSQWDRNYACGVAAIAVCELARHDVEAKS